MKPLAQTVSELYKNVSRCKDCGTLKSNESVCENCGISSNKYKTNSDIGIPSIRFFEQEVKKYCYMWREGGQFSTEKYTSNNDLENKTSQN